MTLDDKELISTEQVESFRQDGVIVVRQAIDRAGVIAMPSNGISSGPGRLYTAIPRKMVVAAFTATCGHGKLTRYFGNFVLSRHCLR